jgi:hypothetical protein
MSLPARRLHQLAILAGSLELTMSGDLGGGHHAVDGELFLERAPPVLAAEQVDHGGRVHLRCQGGLQPGQGGRGDGGIGQRRQLGLQAGLQI